MAIRPIQHKLAVIATGNEYKLVCKRIAPYTSDELHSDVVTAILELSEDKAQAIEPYFKFWFVRVAINQNCKRIEANKKEIEFKNEYKHELPDLNTFKSDLSDFCEKKVKHINDIDRLLISALIRFNDVPGVSEATGIPKRTIYRWAKRVRSEIILDIPAKKLSEIQKKCYKFALDYNDDTGTI